MKKNLLIYFYFIAVCSFNLVEGTCQSFPPFQLAFTNYITISNGEFKNGNTVFKPLCINYLVDYNQNTPKSEYYIAPHHAYSRIMRNRNGTSINDYSPFGHYGYGDSADDEQDSAGIKLKADLQRIKDLGFNVVRLWPSMSWRLDTVHVPTRTYEGYFRLTDSLIAKCTEKGLRVILVLGDRRQCYEQFDKYCVYLDSVTRHYSTNKAVMAYVVYMEPNWKWDNASENDKLMISNWSRKWYYLIKKNAPNQLVTYGLDGIGNVLFWDPSALTYDFLTMHFYHADSNPNVSKMVVHSYFRWLNDNVEDVWVLGETGFSASNDSCSVDPMVGTEAAQYEYAQYTMEKSLSCGCKGYAWWQYQDVYRETSCFEAHLGIYERYPGDTAKSIASLFPAYPPQMQYLGCNRPGCYYNIQGYNHNNFSGVVLDQNSNPIKDAYVVAWSTSNKSIYSTFTDSQGQYTIHTPQDTTIGLVWISKNGYTDKSFFHVGNTFENTTLTRINYNKWKKNWTNVNYPAVGDTIIVSSADTVLVGNFCGDEAQELLVLKRIAGTASLYQFKTNHWERIWNGSIDDWTISSADKFYTGDFNGDGYDELLCVQGIVGGWANIYRYTPKNADTWQYVWSNSGNGNIGNWSYQPGDVIMPGHFNDTTYCSLLCIRKSGKQKAALNQKLNTGSWLSLWTAPMVSGSAYISSWCLGEFDQYYVGDFSGDGIDELFCVQVIGGTTDNMRLMQYNNAWNTLWTNNGQSEGVGIYPYRNHLIVGNFDTDAADEILGVGSWATKFDLNTNNQWDWSWSTYESGRLSDWAVNPNHRTFFMKVMTDVPDYLFVYRGIPRIDFLFDGYTFDP